MRRVLDVLGKLWALPNTLIGLIAGAVAICFGASPRRRHNAVVFVNCRFIRCGAITLGNIILTTEPSLDLLVVPYVARFNSRMHDLLDESPVHLGRHEEAHTYQYQALGPFFLPLYCIAGIGRKVSAFERAADRYARNGTGWWPWST